jgi:hypothetical protein
MTERFELRTRFAIDDAELSELLRRAFGTADHAVRPWSDRLNRHSLTWIGAFDDQELIGFVNLCWDWLHVDYEPHLQAFHEAACGFRPTTAGVLRLGK